MRRVQAFDPTGSWGDDAAGVDETHLRGTERATVAFLDPFAGGGAALELGIGTGRIAVPLAARKVRVDGIDFSPAMVAMLRERPGGEDLSVTVADFADVPVPGTYRLIYVVYNTLFLLMTQDEQVRCFENVAAHLEDGGSFVVEGFDPRALYRRLRNDQYVELESVQGDEVVIGVLLNDAAEQTIRESHVSLSPQGVRLLPFVQRYASPAELDLMARIAGLRLKERWGGWNGEPFDSSSDNCASVYGR
jgi:SAM-dependent methyltransferase